MTTINTIQDLQRILEENPEWRTALRSILLTEDLLVLPQQFSEMTKSVNTLAASVDGLRKHTDIRIDGLEEGIDASVDRLRDDTISRLDTQHRIMRDLQTDYGNFRDNYAESAARKNGTRIAGLFARRKEIEERISARPLSRDELINLLAVNAAAIEELNLEDGAWLSFQEPDLIIEVTLLGFGGKPLFYVAIEASYTVADNDVQRATDNARILRRATGLDAYAVVSGARLSSRLTKPVLESVDEYFTEADPDAALWSQLIEEDMEPLAG